MAILPIILAAFPLSGQPGVILSDRPQFPIEEPRGLNGQVVSPLYNGFTRPGQPSMECFQETHMCYGSDGTMVPMKTINPPRHETNPNKNLFQPNKLHSSTSF